MNMGGLRAARIFEWFDLALGGPRVGRLDFICLLPEEKALLGLEWEEELARAVH